MFSNEKHFPAEKKYHGNVICNFSQFLFHLVHYSFRDKNKSQIFSFYSLQWGAPEAFQFPLFFCCYYIASVCLWLRMKHYFVSYFICNLYHQQYIWILLFLFSWNIFFGVWVGCVLELNEELWEWKMNGILINFSNLRWGFHRKINNKYKRQN